MFVLSFRVSSVLSMFSIILTYVSALMRFSKYSLNIF
jgi:hypothetical protein